MTDENPYDYEPIFVLRAQDATAPLVIDFWESVQLAVRSFMDAGLTLEQAVNAAREYNHVTRWHPGLEEPKLDGAATIARAMEAWEGVKKFAD